MEHATTGTLCRSEKNNGNAISERLYSLDLLKVIAIVFVVSYHLCYYSHDFLSTGAPFAYIVYFFHTILSACVPVFFFVNGYLLFGKPYDLKKHMRKTLKYVSLVFVWAVLLLAGNVLHTRDSLTAYEWFDAILKLDLKREIDLLWYLGALVGIYVLFPALKALFDADIKGFQLITVSLAFLTIGHGFLNDCILFAGKLCSSLFPGVTLPYFTLDNAIFLNFNPFRGPYAFTFVYFCLGGLAWKYANRIFAIPFKKRNAIATAGIVVSCSLLFLQGVFFSRYIDRAVWDVVWYGYDTVFTLVNTCCLFLLSLNYRSKHTVVQHISRNTLGIYLLHTVLARFVQPVISYAAVLFGFVPFNLYLVFIIFLCLLVIAVIRKVPVIRHLL